MVKRIFDCTRSDFEKMDKDDLLESIFAAEGRTILGQVFVLGNLIDGVSNAELCAAFGCDMIFLNGYDVRRPIVLGVPTEKSIELPGFEKMPGYGATINDVKKLVGRPVGVYFECPDPEIEVSGVRYEPSEGRIGNVENIRMAIEQGADFVILGGNPKSGSSYRIIEKYVKEASEKFGDKILIFAGKWEDWSRKGWYMEKPNKEAIKRLIDAGADVIALPAPGYAPRMTIEELKEIADFAHEYKPGTLVMFFINGSQEGSDVETIKRIALWSKMAGADVYGIGDAGYSGMPLPENIMALSLAVRGKRHTYRRMALSYAR